MNKNRLFLLLFVFLAFTSYAQVNDAGLWANISLEKKITQKLSAQLTQSFRLNENYTELGTSFTDLSVDYKLPKKITISLAYRFSQKRRIDDFYSQRHRYNIDIGYKLKVKKMSVIFRERYQSRYRDLNKREKGNIPKNYFRSKITLRYNLNKKYTPFVSAELFYEIGEYVDNLRFKAGFDYDFNKFHSINIYYMIDKEMNVKNPWTSYITGIGYKYNF